MKVTKVEKSARLELREIVELQLNIHFLLQKKIVSPALCTCFAMIAERGKMHLLDICNEASDDGVYSNPMSVRCALNKAVKEGILVKEGGSHRKTLRLSDDIQIASSGNILVTYQFGRRES